MNNITDNLLLQENGYPNAPTQKAIEQRAAFEDWYSDGGTSLRAVERNGDGYELLQTQLSWIAWQAASAQPQSTVSDRLSPDTVRFMPASEVTDSERQYARRSDLYKVGDMILVWANEGDIILHNRFPAPESAAIAASTPKEPA